MKYIINVPEDRVHDNVLCVMGTMEDGVNHYLPTGIKAIPYDESAAEQRGREEAWELAGKIAFNQGNIREILLPNQPDSICSVFDKFSYAEAREKCDLKDEIKIGDEVERDDKSAVFVVTSIRDRDMLYEGFTNTGATLGGYKVHKTGRHFPEVADLLEKMRKPK